MTKPMVSAASADKSAGGREARKLKLTDAVYLAAIRKAKLETLFLNRTLEETVDCKLKPGFDTACWSWLPPHKVYIGTNLFDKPCLSKKLSKEQIQKYIANHYHHELGHGMFTFRNLTRMDAELRKFSCPFGLYNFFEDAYQEHRYRTETGYRFEWLTIESLDFPTKAPDELFFGLIQAEGAVEPVRSAVEALGDSEFLDLLPEVVEFYRRAIGVSDSLALLPVLRDWLKRFPRSRSKEGESQQRANHGEPSGGEAGNGTPSPGNGARFEGELKLGVRLQANPEFAAEFDEGAFTVEQKETDSKSPPDPTMIKGMKCDVKAAGSGVVLSPRPEEELDERAAREAAQRLATVLAAERRRVNVHTPQKRVSARNAALDRAPYRKRVLQGSAMKKIFLVVDCSGSMGGAPIKDGRALVRALSILAGQGLVEGHVAFSEVAPGGVARYETYRFPLSEELCRRIPSDGHGEGLAYTMDSNVKLMADADYCFVYTDACITDAPLNKQKYHRYGIYTLGLYSGNGDASTKAQLDKYFDRSLCHPSLEALIAAMLLQL